MVLRCVYGTCNSDTRYPERLKGIKILPFPKPKTQYNRCLRWIQACGRPKEQLNVNKIDRNKGVCTKHFVDVSGPSKLHPDPLPWTESEVSRARPPPKKKRKKSLDGYNLKQPKVLKKDVTFHHLDASSQTEEMWIPAWDMFTLSAESQRLKEELKVKDSEIKRLSEDLRKKNEELQEMAERIQIQETSGIQINSRNKEQKVS